MEKAKTNYWMWIVLVVIIVGILYFALQYNKTAENGDVANDDKNKVVAEDPNFTVYNSEFGFKLKYAKEYDNSD